MRKGKKLLAILMAIAALCIFYAVASAEDDVIGIYGLESAAGYTVTPLAENGTEVSPVDIKIDGEMQSVFFDAVKLRVSFVGVAGQEYTVFLLSGESDQVGDSNLRYLNQVTGSASTVCEVYPDTMGLAEKYTLYMADAAAQGKYEIANFMGYSSCASIGEAVYTTLGNALADAEIGETVVLQTSCELQESVRVPKGVTLDFAENAKLTFAQNAELIVGGTVSDTANYVELGGISLAPGGSYNGIGLPSGVEKGRPAPTLVYSDWDLDVLGGNKLDFIAEIPDDLSEHKTYVTAVGHTEVFDQFTVYGPAAKHLGETVRVYPTAEDASGELYVGPAVELCLQTYIENELKATNWTDSTESAEGKAMIAMLQYGAAAQNLFDYKTETLANANMGAYLDKLSYSGETLGAYRKDQFAISGSQPDIYYGSSCLLEENIGLRFYFHLPDELKETVQFTANYTDYLGEKHTPAVTLEENEKADYYSWTLTDLTAMDLDTVVTVMAKDAEGNVLTSVSVSLGTYFAQLHEVDTYADTADALLIYALSVRDYYEATK